MARIHAINLYPRPNHSGKGEMLKISNGSPTGMGFGGAAPAFSGAQQRAEKMEAQRVIEGVPSHLYSQGLPRQVNPGRPPMKPPPVTNPLPGITARTKTLLSQVKGPKT